MSIGNGAFIRSKLYAPLFVLALLSDVLGDTPARRRSEEGFATLQRLLYGKWEVPVPHGERAAIGGRGGELSGTADNAGLGWSVLRAARFAAGAQAGDVGSARRLCSQSGTPPTHQLHRRRERNRHFRESE